MNNNKSYQNIMSSLSNYDKEVIEEVIDLMLFNYPEVYEDYIIDKIIINLT